MIKLIRQLKWKSNCPMKGSSASYVVSVCLVPIYRIICRRPMKYDLNVRCKAGGDRERKRIVQRAYALGYDCLCWDIPVVGKVTSSTASPKPVTIDAGFTYQSQWSIKARALSSEKSSSEMTKFRQLSRITITVDELADALALNLANQSLHAYDVIAARPGNQKVFQHLCTTAEIDIITIDFVNRSNLNMNKKLLDEAVRRGIYFELQYAAFIHSPAIRREMLSSTQIALQFLRGRNIVITSAAETANQLRGPHDVMNIGVVLGLNEQNARRSVCENCSLVLKHAARRRQRYLPTEVIPLNELQQRFPELNFNYFSAASQDDRNNKEEVLAVSIETKEVPEDPPEAEQDSDAVLRAADSLHGESIFNDQADLVAFSKESDFVTFSKDPEIDFNAEGTALGTVKIFHENQVNLKRKANTGTDLRKPDKVIHKSLRRHPLSKKRLRR